MPDLRKRRFGLERVMTKLAGTSETSIALTFLVMNLVKLLRQEELSFFVSNFKKLHFAERNNQNCLSEFILCLKIAYIWGS